MNSDQLRETSEYYDTADLSEHIEQAMWEEREPAPEPSRWCVRPTTAQSGH